MSVTASLLDNETAAPAPSQRHRRAPPPMSITDPESTR